MKEISENEKNTVEVARTDEIPVGKTKHVEVNGIEIMVTNIDGN
jgi:nitrite reductase/ring-hydroxylating ferredoxin subunit